VVLLHTGGMPAIFTGNFVGEFWDQGSV
jgi:hypothetical protein